MGHPVQWPVKYCNYNKYNGQGAPHPRELIEAGTIKLVERLMAGAVKFNEPTVLTAAVALLNYCGQWCTYYFHYSNTCRVFENIRIMLVRRNPSKPKYYNLEIFIQPIILCYLPHAYLTTTSYFEVLELHRGYSCNSYSNRLKLLLKTIYFQFLSIFYTAM